jgi:hypothetical protein
MPVPVPESYTEHELAEYMTRAIGPLAGVLSLSYANGSFDEAIRNVALALGVSSVDEADDIPRLRAHADVQVWRVVRDMTVGYYDLRTPDGEQYNRSQIHAHAVQMLHEAEARVAVLEGAGSVQVATITRVPDPYRRWRANGEFG